MNNINKYESLVAGQKTRQRLKQLAPGLSQGLMNWVILLLLVAFGHASCKKLVQIAPPVSSITTTETFADSSDANSAILGIYSKILSQSSGGLLFGNGTITFYAGLSADELIPYNNSGSQTQLYSNTLNATSGITDPIWSQAYSYIYQTNASLEALKASTGLSPSAQSQFIGEVEFLRALCYFYLINLYGDVPYITSSNYQVNAITTKTPKSQIYQQMVADLKDAQTALRSDYSISNNQRTRANKWAATALLARIYLYMGDYTDAETQATSVITNSAAYGLSSLDTVFLANNSEAILQWQLNTAFLTYNMTPEGFCNLPSRPTSPPSLFYISSQLLNSFEIGDRRRITWIDSSIFSGTTYYYSYKYKIGRSNYAINGTPIEYYMVLRLGEQYLIRAEARAQQSTNFAGAISDSGAISDLNSIRNRAGLTPLSSSLSPAQVLAAVAQERKVELFAEWGHRWLDLKRTGAVDSVMSIITPQKGGQVWNTNQQLYPIPLSELGGDPNLVQSPGY
jgi:hypothetical protein